MGLVRIGRSKKAPARAGDCRGFKQSGRPDLNRGPPAPKAGAIPGYATPRGRGKLLYPAFSAQRGEECAECASPVASCCGVRDARLSECASQIGRFEVRVVA